MTQDPYEAQREACKQNGGHEVVKGHNVCCNDDNVHVHHPVQPKTQVERWREEIHKNLHTIGLHCGSAYSTENCTLEGTDNCNKRVEKICELTNLILEKKTKKIHPRYPSAIPSIK